MIASQCACNGRENMAHLSVRPSYMLGWASPDLAVDNMRQLVNFYDQVIKAAVDLGIIDPSEATIFAQGQHVVAILYAAVSLQASLKQTDAVLADTISLQDKVFDAYTQIRDAVSKVMLPARDSDDISPGELVEFVKATLTVFEQARYASASAGK